MKLLKAGELAPKRFVPTHNTGFISSWLKQLNPVESVRTSPMQMRSATPSALTWAAEADFSLPWSELAIDIFINGGTRASRMNTKQQAETDRLARVYAVVKSDFLERRAKTRAERLADAQAKHEERRRQRAGISPAPAIALPQSGIRDPARRARPENQAADNFESASY